jgi:hypothetical protein
LQLVATRLPPSIHNKIIFLVIFKFKIDYLINIQNSYQYLKKINF